MSPLTQVYSALSMIQRDAIVAHLEGIGIECRAMERDISRRYADSTIDLAFEGYSATMGGFPIYVPADQTEEAKAEIKKYLRMVDAQVIEPTPTTNNLNRFYVAALFSFAMPIFIPFAIHRLVIGLRQGEKLRLSAFVPSLVMMLLGTGLWSLLIYAFVGNFAHPSVNLFNF